MKSFDEKIKEALISVCTTMFEEMRRYGRNTVYCGTPPEILLMHIGRFPAGEKTTYEKLAKGTGEAFVYVDRQLVPTSMKRKRSTKKQGVYFEEAYAVAGYDDRGKAYITMDYGPRYANCCAYDIIDDGKDCRLANEHMLWIS